MLTLERPQSKKARTKTNPEYYEVVHPLDDVAEEKCNPDNLTRMHMTGSVKLSLMALRGYLIVMLLLVTYRVVIMVFHG
jgi:hypothetical protein